MNIEDFQTNRDSKTFYQVKSVYDLVKRIINSEDIKIYAAGGIVPYILNNEESNRLHDDIDTVCDLENMSRIREIFQDYGLYNPNLDSLTHSNDGVDYGFEMIVQGVPFGIFPFTYDEDEKIIIQYSYDPYTTECKIKEVPCEQLSDYVCTYKGKDGNMYNTMSLEMIKYTKNTVNREKDLLDLRKISEIGYRTEVYDRLKPIIEIQKVKASELPPKKKAKAKTKVRELPKIGTIDKGYSHIIMISLIVIIIILLIVSYLAYLTIFK